MKRLYWDVIIHHIQSWRQMVFIMGPRQVGKTTLSLALTRISHTQEKYGLKDGVKTSYYFNWDNQKDRSLILEGPDAVAESINLHLLSEEQPILIFDEIHKYRDWKIFLKGFYDSYPNKMHIVVTGSARMDVFNRGGESLMGRYFPYRLHPLSVAEIGSPQQRKQEINHRPFELPATAFETLLIYGGFPDPYLKADPRFVNQWRKLRLKQLFEDDIRDLSRVREIKQLEVLAELLRLQVGSFVSFDSMAKKLRVSDNTVRNWVSILQALYYIYEIKPWSKNIARSLIKEPKYFLWDWSLTEDEGKRTENFIISHLLKAVHFWTDCGFGEYDIYYIRDKEKREVDCLVTKNDTPWFLVEIKHGQSKTLSPHLIHFHKALKTKHAFQVVLNMPYVDTDCFAHNEPIIVPAKTFLSQLI